MLLDNCRFLPLRLYRETHKDAFFFKLDWPPNTSCISRAADVTFRNILSARGGERLMAYRSEMVGPIAYSQKNSGVNTDTTTPIEYRPEQYRAPFGAQIIPGSVSQSYAVSRGLAYVQNVESQRRILRSTSILRPPRFARR